MYVTKYALPGAPFVSPFLGGTGGREVSLNISPDAPLLPFSKVGFANLFTLLGSKRVTEGVGPRRPHLREPGTKSPCSPSQVKQQLSVIKETFVFSVKRYSLYNCKSLLNWVPRVSTVRGTVDWTSKLSTGQFAHTRPSFLMAEKMEKDHSSSAGRDRAH